MRSAPKYFPYVVNAVVVLKARTKGSSVAYRLRSKTSHGIIVVASDYGVMVDNY